MKSIYEMQAEICKVLSSPTRIEIITILKGGERSVSELADLLGTPNISQHLSQMKAKGILKHRRDGVNTYYSIAHSKIIEVCTVMREVLTELLTERGEMARMLKKAS